MKKVVDVVVCGGMVVATESNSPFLEMEVLMIVAKFSTLAGGVFIEENGTELRFPTDRCFRFDKDGNSEFAYFAVLASNDPLPRWYGHQYKERDFILC